MVILGKTVNRVKALHICLLLVSNAIKFLFVEVFCKVTVILNIAQQVMSVLQGLRELLIRFYIF